RIDINIENFLYNRFQLNRPYDYEIIRYVDDYIVFSKNKETSKKIFNAISDYLNEYNLYLSEEKTKKYERPLIT
ncbi:hypothetical protein CGJ95_23925, partial [Vibrio parahaemolyticus]|uniref:reverse transcriptase domain-containing protein n=4 Tax=Vibrio TaxID=662 RepID=UPI00116BE374